MKLFMLVGLVLSYSVAMAVNMSSILVVIDMQKGFDTSKSSIKHVERLISEYKKRERPILFVTIPGFGELYDELADASKDYTYKFAIEKNSTDGSQNIMDFFQKTKMSPDRITVVGLNTCCCVYKTVVGLNDKLPQDSSVKILVDPQGCHCHGHKNSYPFPCGDIMIYYSCISKEEKYQKMSQLTHVKVKSSKDAPKRNQTKKEMRLKKVEIDPSLHGVLKNIEAKLKQRSLSPDEKKFLNVLSPFLKNFNHE